jgi:ubiquinol-cytochrome c reductase cytochrome c1 subunit
MSLERNLPTLRHTRMGLRKMSGLRKTWLALLLASGLSFGLAPPLLAAESDSSQSGGGLTGSEEHAVPSRQHWSFAGPLGKFDPEQLQRGYKVYHDVCSTCHSLKFLAFRDLADPEGPDFSDAQVKALAATYKIEDGPNDSGAMFQRPGRPSDNFPWAFANAEAAKAALGAVPPDMSLLAKARTYARPFPLFIFDAVTEYQEQGPDYIVAILNGYTHPKDDHWNLYFPGHVIAMPRPLKDGAVQYTDGAPQTLTQYSHDVAAFLYWAAEPKLEDRKKMGLRVIAFLIVFAVLLYFTKRRIWAGIPEH